MVGVSSNVRPHEEPVSDPYSPYPMLQRLAAGTRVLVAATCAGWRNEARGVIHGDPEPVRTVRGEDYWYWVEFDTPQHDLSDDGPYHKAQILSCCLTPEA